MEAALFVEEVSRLNFYLAVPLFRLFARSPTLVNLLFTTLVSVSTHSFPVTVVRSLSFDTLFHLFHVLDSQ